MPKVPSADHQDDQSVTGEVVLTRLKVTVAWQHARKDRRASGRMTGWWGARRFLLDEEVRVRNDRHILRTPFLSSRRSRAD